MLSTISKAARLKILNLYRDLYKAYIRDKYNILGDICFIYSHDHKNLLYMTDTHRGVCAVSDKTCEYIRRICGENKLMEYGIPQPDQIIPQLVLVPTPSMFIALGPIRFIKFLRDWPGNSKVGDVTVIKYSVLW
jgi:hypothetical protein